MGGLARARARLSAAALARDHAAGGAHRDPAHGRLPGAAREGDGRRFDHRLRGADACRAADDQRDVPADDRLSDRRGALFCAVLAAVAMGAASGETIARRERHWEKTMSRAKIGYIGVGLMGHGAAKNILEKGHPLAIMGHRNRAPVDDLMKRGAKEGQSGAEIARASDILFLCLPSSVEVEATVYGAGGVLEGAHAGLIVVDSTTVDPNSTRRIPEAPGAKGARMLDAPLGRTPKEAEQGALSTYVGGAPETIKAVRPIMECYADTIVEV